MVRSTLLCLCVRVALRGKNWFQRSFVHRFLKVKFGSIAPLQNTNNCILGMFLLMIDGLKSKFAQEVFANFVISLLCVPKFDKKQNVPKSFKINSSVFQNMFWTVGAQHSPLSCLRSLVEPTPCVAKQSPLQAFSPPCKNCHKINLAVVTTLAWRRELLPRRPPRYTGIGSTSEHQKSALQ